MKRFTLTSSTVSILKMFRDIYTHAYNNSPDSDGARLYRACNDAFYNNNELVNILKVCIIVENSATLVRIGQILPVTYEVLLRDMSRISGYSETEISERVEYYQVS